jgi:hypothetical protein
MIYSAIGGVCKCKGGVFNEFDTINYREVAYDCVQCRVYYRVALNTLEIVELNPKLVLVLKPIAPWIEVT